jgi:phage-related protein
MAGSKPTAWIGSSRDDLRSFPDEVRRVMGFAIYVLHAFQKKSRKGLETPKHEIDVIKARLRMAEAHYRQNYGKGGEK